MGTKRLMSLSSLCFIKPHSSHRSFVLSCVIIDLFSTSFPMQTTNYKPPIISPHLTNHTPPIVLFTIPLFFMWLQPYNFPNPFDHVRVGPFPPFILSTPIVVHDWTSQPTPFPQHTCNFHLKSLALPLGPNLPIKG
jgi:hypothetical protein